MRKRCLAVLMVLCLMFGTFGHDVGSFEVFGAQEIGGDKLQAAEKVGIDAKVKRADALKEGDFEYAILEDGTVEITDYTGNAKNLIVPEKINGHTVAVIGYNAFYNCDSLMSIEFPLGLVSIDNGAFSRCNGLTGIEFPPGLTRIGEYAFHNCDSLTGIEFPSGLMSIGYCAFYNCNSLTDIKLPSGLTSIGNYAFASCDSLTGIELPSGLTSIGEDAFYGCNNLTIYCIEGSYAHTYAEEKGIPCILTVSDDGNYIFKYNGRDYISTAYNDFSNNTGWVTTETATIKSGKFDWAKAVASAINANGGSDNALNVDVNNDSAINKINLGRSIISMVHGFVTGGREGVTDVKLMLQSNGKKNRMLLMYGGPIESYYAGKTVWLHEILTNAHSGNAAYFLRADEDEDAIIRKCFKGLNKDGKYSMKITFSKLKDYEDSPYKYTIVLSNNGKVYQYPILHNGTKMEVYYKPKGGKAKFAFDATKLVNSEKIELDGQVGKDIKTFLNTKDWKNKAKNQTIKVTGKYTKVLGNKAFSLGAKAKTALSYKSNNTKVATVNSKGKVTIKGVGKVVITVTARGTEKYNKATEKVTVTVNPKSAKITKATRQTDKKAVIKWNKVNGVDGYIIEYSTNAKFKDAKTTKIKNGSKIKTTISDLKKGKKYYVRIQTYKKVGGLTYKSKWSGKKGIAKK